MMLLHPILTVWWTLPIIAVVFVIIICSPVQANIIPISKSDNILSSPSSSSSPDDLRKQSQSLSSQLSSSSPSLQVDAAATDSIRFATSDVDVDDNDINDISSSEWLWWSNSIAAKTNDATTITNNNNSIIIDNPPPPPDCSIPNHNRFACWLYHLSIEIPDQSFTEHWITIDIKNMVCSEFQLQHLDATTATTTNYDENVKIRQNSNSSNNVLGVTASELSAVCHGSYHLSGGLSGDVQASLEGGTDALKVAFEIISKPRSSNNNNNNTPRTSETTNPKLPSKFVTSECNTNLNAHGIQFTGSISAKIIQMFAKSIGKYITQEIQENICPLFKQKLDPLVTSYFDKFDIWVQQYIQNRQSDYDDDDDNDGIAVLPSVQQQQDHPVVGATSRTRKRRRRLGNDYDESDEEGIKYPTNNQNMLRPNTKRQAPPPELQYSDDDNGSYGHSRSKNASSNPVYPQEEWTSVKWLLEFVNNQVEQHLQQGWLFHTDIVDYYNLPADCRNMFRGISGWLVSLLGESIDIVLPHYFHNITIPNMPLGTSLSLGCDRFFIRGLDLLDTFQLMRPKNNNTNDDDVDGGPPSSSSGLESILSTKEGFHIQIPLQVEFQLPHAKHKLQEALTVHINITEMETTLTSLIQVIDWDKTTVLQVVNAIQDYVDTKDWHNSVACLVRTVKTTKLTDWVATIVLESISLSRHHQSSSTNSSSSVEDDIDNVINVALDLAATEYSMLWTQLINGLVDGPGRLALERFISQWLDDHKSTHACDPIKPTDGKPKWLNFTKIDLLYKLNNYFNHQHTKKTMNHFLQCVGELATEATMMNNSTATIISQMETSNWDQLQNFELIKPSKSEPTVLTSQIEWGKNSTMSTLLPGAMVTLDVPNFNTTVNVTAFTRLAVLAGIQLDYNLNALQNMTVSHLLQHVQCAMLPALELRFLPTSFLRLPSLGFNVSAAIQNENGTIDAYHISSKDYEALTSNALDVVMNWFGEWLRQFTNQVTRQVLIKTPETCPGILPSPDNNDDDDYNKNHFPDTKHLSWNRNPFLWLIVFIVCLAQYGLVWIAQGRNSSPETDEPQGEDGLDDIVISRRMEEIIIMNPLEEEETDHHDLLQQSILNDFRDTDRSLLSDIRQQIDQEHEEFILAEREDAILNHSSSIDDDGAPTKTLLMEPRLPGPIRLVLPACVIGTMILLFSSNVSVGASVDMSVTVQDKRFHLPGLFEFSLVNTATELFQAGIYPLFLLVVVFSGIWPYAKLALMLHVWTKPYINPHQREQRLLVLDALSKFSLVDTYVLVVMLVAFRFHLEISESLGLDVLVTPKYGFYAFLLATMLSLILGHGMLYCHRRALALRLSCLEQQSGEEIRESICSHRYDVGGSGQGQQERRRRKLSFFFKLLFVLSILSAIALLIIGFAMESFSFEFGGLAGMALGERKRSSYSLVSLGLAIPASVEHPGFSVRLLQAAYYFYAVITPLCCLVFLLILFVIPMSFSKQRWVLVAAEVANAWSAVEVFCLSIGAALLQISTFASFIIGDRCDIINMLLRDVMDKGGDKGLSCFTVEASIEPEFWYLIGGAILNSIVVSFGLRLAHLFKDDRQEERLMPSAEASFNFADGDEKSTLAERIYQLPMLGCIVFGWRGSSEEEGDRPRGTEADLDEDSHDSDTEDEEEERPDWRHWF